MTPEAIRIAKEALELAGKATPEPWNAENREMATGYGHEWLCVFPNGEDASVLASGDAIFIAFARTALPILARAVLESRSAEQERADVATWLRATFFAEGNVTAACFDFADAIERGDRIGAADKSRKEPIE